MKIDEVDPRGLIGEAYRMRGIDAGQCRSIFLDWLLGANEAALAEQIGVLLAHHGGHAPDHPMTEVLKQALAAPPGRGRRQGGWRGRRQG